MERRFYLGLGILIFFLALGLLGLMFLNHVHSPISGMLTQARDAALTGKLEAGAALAQQAKHAWKSHWYTTAVLADHTPMDEIDGLFAELEVYAWADEPVHFAACCADLTQKVQAVTDAHSPTWWNLL